MILSDYEIVELARNTRNKFIVPYEHCNVQPASIDVRLGNDFKIFQRDSETVLDFNNPIDITKDVHVDNGDYFTLHPGEFALGVTREVVKMPTDIVGRLEGKSSIGRLGLFIHVTAGFIDPGFHGPITLEMYGLHPLPMMLYPGMLIAQLSFHRMSRAAAFPYQGRYQNAETVESSKYGKVI